GLPPDHDRQGEVGRECRTQRRQPRPPSSASGRVSPVGWSVVAGIRLPGSLSGGDEGTHLVRSRPPAGPGTADVDLGDNRMRPDIRMGSVNGCGRRWMAPARPVPPERYGRVAMSPKARARTGTGASRRGTSGAGSKAGKAPPERYRR